MTPTLLFMQPPPSYSPAHHHHGYNDAGYRGSQVNSTLHTKAHVHVLYRSLKGGYACCDAEELNIVSCVISGGYEDVELLSFLCLLSDTLASVPDR